MAAHRAWRLFCTQHGGANYVLLNEVYLAATPGGAQGAVGGTASSSGDSSTNYASKAFDGIEAANNGWVSVGANNVWLDYDMGVGNSLDVVELRIYYNGSASSTTQSYPAAFMLLYSDDVGVSWKMQRAWSGQTSTNGATNVLNTTPLSSGDIKNRVVLDRYSARYNGAAHVGSPAFRRVFSFPLFMGLKHAAAPVRRTPHTGNYYIAGSTTVLGEPAARRVWLVEQKSGLLAAVYDTGEDGHYEFQQVAYGPWTLVGVDVRAEQNSVIYAHVVAEPLP